MAARKRKTVAPAAGEEAAEVVEKPPVYRFTRFIDRHRPGDMVPEGVYSAEDMAKMLAAGRIEAAGG